MRGWAALACQLCCWGVGRGTSSLGIPIRPRSREAWRLQERRTGSSVRDDPSSVWSKGADRADCQTTMPASSIGHSGALAALFGVKGLAKVELV